jgi:hypothetical protein
MTIKEKHQTCIDLLDAIEYFDGKISTRRDSMDSFVVRYFDLEYKWMHDIDIYTRCIARLRSRYHKVMKSL